MRFGPPEQQILSGYQAIDVPPAFRTAHAALLADDTASLAWMDEVIHDVNTQRPPQEWFPAVTKHAEHGRDPRTVRPA
jgi:hypothetical protein